MRPDYLIDLLIGEHDTIHSGLFLLDEAASMLEASKAVPQGFQPWIFEFLRNFADRCHHAKEEGVLFPALMQKGDGSLNETINTLLQDHVDFRDCIATLERLDLNSATARLEFASLAHRYVDNLRQHIFVENRQVFVAARRLFTHNEFFELLSAAEQADTAGATTGHRERYTPPLKGWQSKILSAAGS